MAKELGRPSLTEISDASQGSLFQTDLFTYQFPTAICTSGRLIKTEMTPLPPETMTTPPTNVSGSDSGTAATCPTCPFPSLAWFSTWVARGRTFPRHFCPFNSQSKLRCSRQQVWKITFLIFSSHPSHQVLIREKSVSIKKMKSWMLAKEVQLWPKEETGLTLSPEFYSFSIDDDEQENLCWNFD